MAVKNFRHLLNNSEVKEVNIGCETKRTKHDDTKHDSSLNERKGISETRSLPKGFYVAKEDFKPLDSILGTLYCLRTRCMWSVADRPGCEDGRWSCLRLSADEDGYVIYSYRTIPKGALVRNCPRLNGELDTDRMYGVHKVETEETGEQKREGGV